MDKTKVSKYKKTYTALEVEEYLRKMLSASEITARDQKDRINELKKQVDELQGEIVDLTEKNKMLSRAMNEAGKLVKEQAKEQETRNNLQVEKMKTFGIRWRNYLDELFTKIPELKGNNSNILFEQEMLELIDQFEEFGRIRSSLKEKTLPKSKKNKELNSDEWLTLAEVKAMEEPDYSLSKDNEIKYQKLMGKLRDQMVFASELSRPSEEGFDLQEALNPSDSLKKIIGDIL